MRAIINSADEDNMVGSVDIGNLLSVEQWKEGRVTPMFLAQPLNIIMVGPFRNKENRMRADLGRQKIYVEGI